ncbi:ATP-binding protein [Achromobacter deleyi]|uniref:ATP-binding protein n=1 Tax=Achromobacter deleyi TaxID=1353891 RepID=UPI001492FA95|nr:ATP-binding protein [Achromobacter deleyi]QVQ26172.1 HAMP domain-containing protein [Achromobacter deleyi]UIP21734.1 ATP-binding protein [Achromobacter deleyi]
MSAAATHRPAWPRTLVARLFLIFLTGLILAYGLSFASLFYERYSATRSMMLGDLERDVAIAMDILDRLPAEERPAWLPRLSSNNRQYLLGNGKADQPLGTDAARHAAQAIEAALGAARPVTIRAMADDPRHIQAQVVLSDGQPAVLDIELSRMRPAPWLLIVLGVQLLLLIVCAWLAVRLAVRPLTRLARAAEELDPNAKSPLLNETGPAEVAHAAIAFNAMQDRISAHVAERMQMLGAISHDLQTPITRMKLRTEFMEACPDRDKLAQDLDEVERLVREGIDYARSAHGKTETPARIDLNAFLDSLVCDYQDTGKQVTLDGHCAAPIHTRPHALRRILGNLIDNALKFAGAADVRVAAQDDGHLSIFVLDRGPGIPAGELDAVLQPFYRLESSRSRDTGGTGLGLAIAQQLAAAIGGRLILSNREGGGLSAEIRIAPDENAGRPAQP